MTENVNKIEIVGRVGAIKVSEVDGKKLGRLSVATMFIYKGHDGCPVIETTWHTVTCWENDKMLVSDVKKGDAVRIVGRVRHQKYAGADGTEHLTSEIVANEFTKLEE